MLKTKIGAKRGRKLGTKLIPVTLSSTATVVRPSQQIIITGVSKGTAYRLEKLGLFPKRRILSLQAVGWLRTELEDWVRSRRAVTGGVL